MQVANADGRQRIFIGDVQGCASELEDLLQELRYQPSRHALYFCGDLVNRGPRSLDALRLAREVAAGTVLGNHDLHLIASAAGVRGSKDLDTIEEILTAPDGPELIDWLRGQPVIIEWPDIVLVHAALHPGWTNLGVVRRRVAAEVDWTADPMANADLRFATTVRYCDAAGNLPARDIALPARRATRPGHPGAIAPPYAPWDTFWHGPRTVVFGHWAERGLVREETVRGLDTGCVWGGRLTAWIAEEDRFVSVPARRTYQTVQ